MSRVCPLTVVTLFAFSALPHVVDAQQAPRIEPGLFSELRWRNIGPMRAGRTRAAAGHASHPYTFYIGVVNGGVWKTTDAGRTWTSIFDEQPTQSVGAVVVAPSNPNVIYVGSGEGLQRPDLSVGDGVYRSTDAGATWRQLGLRDAQQIAAIAVDPRDANRLFVAALGHPYGPNAERGIYLSTDGGETFRAVLQRGPDVGGNDVDIDPSNPQVVYANLWESRQGPWENAAWSGTGGGLFKSTDGGATWKQLTDGLPEGVNQVNLAISPSSTQRLYATVASGTGVGFYRSDDSGESWTRITTDTRPVGRIGGGDLPVPTVDPKNPDVILMASTVSWKSVDGGRTWAPYKGAPGGEDYQGIWINPDDPNIVLLAADQGAVVTLNGGASWSAWYNQSTAQLYHIAADNSFPYRLCSGQQESGSACVASRGNYGAISVRDWLPVGVDEYGYVAPDPLNADLVYGGRSVTRFDRRTGQVSNVSPIAGGRGGAPGPGTLTFRQVRTQPVVFSAAEPRALYFANNYLWKTVDGGVNWKRISPDLTRTTYALPANIGKYGDPTQVTQRGVIYTIGPSPREAGRLWIGTDDGLIHVTSDSGAHWQDVTPPHIGPWWKVFMIDAGHFDTRTAYAAVNTLRLDDMRPHLYRTHDGGKTWTEIVKGMEDAGAANAIREDPVKRGLLYASTERGVWVSLNDGDTWHSLQQNLPRSSARDIMVKDDDLAVATHGRGFWILDDITPLRQINATTLDQNAVLFKPTTAWRVRWNTSTDMPWPKEEPVLPNPPDGVTINYYLRTAATTPVVIEIVGGDGRLVRRYSSEDPVTPIPAPEAAAVPRYWYKPPQRLATNAGLHRWVWDVHLQPLGGAGGGRGGLPISAVPGNAAPAVGTPWANPGTYTVNLTVNGQTLGQQVTVRQDPRVRTPAAAMQQVYAQTKAVYDAAVDVQAAGAQIAALRAQINALRPQASGAAASQLASFDERLSALLEPTAAPDAGGRGGRGGGGGGGGRGGAVVPSLPALAALTATMNSLQAADVQPTAVQLAAITSARAAATQALSRWIALRASLPQVNRTLQAAGLTPLEVR
jgi:photosystem II stability/assembly factor-like uncharacterized protein